MVKITEALSREFLEAYGKSIRRYRDNTIKHVEECDEDGKPCPFLRALKGRGYIGSIVAYYCVFNGCVRRYPTQKDIFNVEKEVTEE